MQPQDTWTSLPASVSLHSLVIRTDQGFLKDEVPQFWPCLFSFRRCCMHLQSYLMRAGGQKKAKLSICKAVFVPILTYGHESWVMTERMRSQVQASEMRFLRRIEGVTLFNKVRSSEIRKSLNVEPLLLRIERSQLRWFGHVSRMPQERLPKQALHAKANGRRPVGRPRTRWTDYIEDLGWNRLGLRPSEMMEVMEDREVWRLNLELLPPQPSRKSGQWRKKKKKFYFTVRKCWHSSANIVRIVLSSAYSNNVL